MLKLPDGFVFAPPAILAYQSLRWRYRLAVAIRGENNAGAGDSLKTHAPVPGMYSRWTLHSEASHVLVAIPLAITDLSPISCLAAHMLTCNGFPPLELDKMRTAFQNSADNRQLPTPLSPYFTDCVCDG